MSPDVQRKVLASPVSNPAYLDLLEAVRRDRLREEARPRSGVLLFRPSGRVFRRGRAYEAELGMPDGVPCLYGDTVGRAEGSAVGTAVGAKVAALT